MAVAAPHRRGAVPAAVADCGDRVRAKTGGARVAAASRPHRQVLGPTAPAGPARVDTAAVRRAGVPRRHPPLDGEHACHPARVAYLVSAVLWPPEFPAESGGVPPGDVDRSCRGRGSGRGAGRRARYTRGRLAVRHPPARPLAGRPCGGLVDQQAGQAARGRVERSAAGVPACSRPAHMALFRRFRRPRRQLATTGQLSGVSGFRGRSAHLPHEHGHGAAGKSRRS
jgi:hypothetical protein